MLANATTQCFSCLRVQPLAAHAASGRILLIRKLQSANRKPQTANCNRKPRMRLRCEQLWLKHGCGERASGALASMLRILQSQRSPQL